MDANFRLRRRDVSSEGRDPSYSNGWSYFVQEAAHKPHLKTFDGKVTQSVHIQVSINVKSFANLNCSECLLQPPSSQRRTKWKGSSCHGSSGSPLCSTWLYPCPRHGRPPKRRMVRTLKPCHSLHNLMLQQLGQHGLLVYFQSKSTGHSTPPGVHRIL